MKWSLTISEIDDGGSGKLQIGLALYRRIGDFNLVRVQGHYCCDHERGEHSYSLESPPLSGPRLTIFSILLLAYCNPPLRTDMCSFINNSPILNYTISLCTMEI